MSNHESKQESNLELFTLLININKIKLSKYARIMHNNIIYFHLRSTYFFILFFLLLR